MAGATTPPTRRLLPNRAIARRSTRPARRFKLVVSAAALSSGALHARQRSSPRRLRSRCRAPTPSCRTSTATPAAPARRRRLRDALQRSCNTAFARARERARRAGAARAGRDVRHRLRRPARADAGGHLHDRRHPGRRRAVAVQHRPARRRAHAAAERDGRGRPSPTAASVMQPYLVSEIQSQELDPVETTSPDRIEAGHRPERREHPDRDDGQQREQLLGQRQDHRRADRVQDRHRRARAEPASGGPARLVRRVRPGRGPAGRGRGAGRVRWRPQQPRGHRRHGRRPDRPRRDPRALGTER